jgi:acyl carrier protein
MTKRIIEVVSLVFNLAADENTSQRTCAEWDSLRHLNLIVELELEFDVSFEPEEIAQMKNIASIERILKTKL